VTPTRTAARFEHGAFPLGLGFVAGSMDAFGFIALYGLLPAHVTGNLVLLAVNLSHGQHGVGMKLAALPVFALGAAASAWCVGMLREKDRDAFLPAISLQAGLIAVCLAVSLTLPKADGPNDLSAVVVGCFALLAMSLQNVTMRLVLNNLPPTTVMTGNITQVVSDTVAFAFHFPSLRNREDEKRLLSHQAERMALTLSGFTAGSLVTALGYRAVGASILVVPIVTLISLVPFGRAALTVSRQPSSTL
jgi:uncharacterized membrane protein YoaK (UPF0700 family)